MPISGRVDRASAAEAVDSGSISCRVKPKTIKKRDSVKPLPCVVDRWAGGSVTRRPKKVPLLFPGQGNLVNKM